MQDQDKAIRAILLDLSGVLYVGEQLIPGAIEAVRLARSKKLTLRFVTNTATKTTRAIVSKLAALGIDVKEGELITAPMAARRYFERCGLRPYCVVHEAIRADFSDLNQDQPNAVLLGDARDDLNYPSLNQAFRLCVSGAPLIGIGYNKFFRDESGLNLDAGAFIHALEWAAGCEAIIMGKPSKAFFAEVVATTSFRADQCLMIGDDVHCDVLGAIDAGLQGCLVKTGKYQAGDEKSMSDPAMLIGSIADLRLLI